MLKSVFYFLLFLFFRIFFFNVRKLRISNVQIRYLRSQPFFCLFFLTVITLSHTIPDVVEGLPCKIQVSYFQSFSITFSHESVIIRIRESSKFSSPKNKSLVQFFILFSLSMHTSYYNFVIVCFSLLLNSQQKNSVTKY